jgi:hypothetical protein
MMSVETFYKDVSGPPKHGDEFVSISLERLVQQGFEVCISRGRFQQGRPTRECHCFPTLEAAEKAFQKYRRGALREAFKPSLLPWH